jgi:hypothetical protein
MHQSVLISFLVPYLVCFICLNVFNLVLVVMSPLLIAVQTCLCVLLLLIMTPYRLLVLLLLVLLALLPPLISLSLLVILLFPFIPGPKWV